MPENRAAIISSSITPKLFLIFLSTNEMGNGFTISKKRKSINPNITLLILFSKKS